MYYFVLNTQNSFQKAVRNELYGRRSPYGLIRTTDRNFHGATYFGVMDAEPKSVAVLIDLVRAVRLDTDITSLKVGEDRKFGAEFPQLQTRHFFDQALWQHI